MRHVSPPGRHMMSLASLLTPEVGILEKVLRISNIVQNTNDRE